MADPRFFRRAGPFSLADLAAAGGATLADPADGGRRVVDVAPLDLAGPDDVSFLDNHRYLPQLRATRAGACVLRPRQQSNAPAGVALLLSAQPYRTYALIAQAFYPIAAVTPGVHASAVVHPDAILGEDVEIGANAVVGARAEVGSGSRIGPNATVGEGVVVGPGCRIAANVSLAHCILGARVTLHAGVRIGEDGFGFAPDAAGHVKVPQIGRVLVGDGCDIGANTTIDRGSLQDTVIGEGCWIDNLVQIGHNVRLGRGCIVVAQVGISGSTEFGDFVQIGGQAGFAGHLRIGSGARIAAQSGVINDIPAGATVGGSPAQDHMTWWREVAATRRLAKRKDGEE